MQYKKEVDPDNLNVNFLPPVRQLRFKDLHFKIQASPNLVSKWKLTSYLNFLVNGAMWQ